MVNEVTKVIASYGEFKLKRRLPDSLSSVVTRGLEVVTTGRALVPVTRVLVPPFVPPTFLSCLGSGTGTGFFGTVISLLSSSLSSSTAGLLVLVAGCGLSKKIRIIIQV